jgi:hypothetical protein
MTSEGIYRILLKAYPTRYRRHYEEAMAQCFRDQLRAADTMNERIRLWFRTIADFALSAPARHFDLALNISYANAYSEGARRAIYLAQLEKGPFSYGEISLEQLLLGALRSDEELNSALLGSDGIDTLVSMVRAWETKKVAPPSPLLRWGRRHRRAGTLDLDCKKALAFARREAHDSGTSVSSRHILLGILEQETSQAARTLRDCARNLTSLRPSPARDNPRP